MFDAKKRLTRAEVFVHLMAVLVGTAIICFFAFGAALAAFRMYGKLETATAAADEAQGQLSRLTLADASVKSDIEGLTSNRGVEAALRERYGLIKPGEGVIQIVEAKSSAMASTSPSTGNVFEEVFHVLGW